MKWLLSQLVIGVLVVVGTATLGVGNVEAGMVSVSETNSGAENLLLTSVGATTASNVSFGNYVVGPAGDIGKWARPIILFDRTNFASIAGASLLSATLNFNIVSDFAETGESFLSEVRMFTTNETGLTVSNRNIFAGLTGDGGANTAVGTVTFLDGVTGPQAQGFSAAALASLQSAINGTDAFIGVTFREFAQNDALDEFVLGVPPTMSLDVTAVDVVPEPSSLVYLVLGTVGLVVMARRQRKRKLAA